MRILRPEGAELSSPFVGAKFPTDTDTASGHAGRVHALKHRKMAGARIERKRLVDLGDLGFGQM
jgi:hypothetical protein